jgi:hypothetical protein
MFFSFLSKFKQDKINEIALDRSHGTDYFHCAVSAAMTRRTTTISTTK